ncbi:antitoxin [Amycolatopsis sp. H20-H5]|uniref:antitoxin n=1 Tax=Amycolatopsis sp. H20-H5 TaxID=3046309 RepID=UPI002DBBB9A9|nr:antitoxin [Amycolatopsis sp. H20-H5]MEC3976462.1 antitoxin [Amycolatopsis sp. H20-H5]
MAFLRKLTALAGVAGAARAYARKNPEKVGQAVDKAARFVDQQTKGKYHTKIDGAVRKVDDATGRRKPGQ